MLPEPKSMTRGIDLVGERLTGAPAKKDGFFVRLGNMMPGAGWIALGPGYRQHLADSHVLIEGAAAVSWREYKIAEARLEFAPKPKHLVFGVQDIWQDATQVNFFGTGGSSVRSNRSEYRFQGNDASAYVLGTARAFSLGVREGYLNDPTISEHMGWHDPGFPATQSQCAATGLPGLATQTSFLHTDVTATVDTLNSVGRPTRGALVQLDASAYHDRNGTHFSFNRYELVAVGFIPVTTEIWTIAMRGSAILSDTSKGNQVAFYMLPSLGGQNALRGYLDYRFQDRDLAAFNIESRWAMLPHMDVAIFGDLGTVAGSADDLRRAVYHRSAGFGFRVHTKERTVVSLDVAHSVEGWRFLFKASESLMFSTLRRWATVLPILP
jgi:hypothetical protein